MPLIRKVGGQPPRVLDVLFQSRFRFVGGLFWQHLRSRLALLMLEYHQKSTFPYNYRGTQKRDTENRSSIRLYGKTAKEILMDKTTWLIQWQRITIGVLLTWQAAMNRYRIPNR